MGVGDKQTVDEIVFLRGGRLPAAATAPLRAVIRDRLRLHVAAVRERHHHVFGSDQVFHAQILGVGDDLAAALVPVLLFHLREFLRDDPGHARRLRQHVDEIDDLVHRFLVLRNELVLLQRRQVLQAHLEDALGLDVRELVTLPVQPEVGREALRPRHLPLAAREQFFDQLRAPETPNQLGLGVRRRRRGLDQRDHVVNVGQRDSQAFQDMAALARLAQLEDSAARDDLAPVAQEGFQKLSEIEQARLAVDQRHHVHPEAVLELRLFPQVVEDDFRHFAALEFDHRAHAGPVGLVADVGDALDLLLAHQFADLHQQIGLVHLVRQFVDDDRHAAALFRLLEMGARPHHHLAAAGAIALVHAGKPVDDATRRKIRRRHDLDEVFEPDLGVLEQRLTGLHHLREVVGGDVGRHADRDTGGAIDQQVGDARGQRRGLPLLAVVVGDKIDGLHVDVRQQLGGDLRQPALGVAVGRGRITIDRAEITLAIDEGIAHREVLRHPHQRLVGRRVTVGVIFSEHVAHYPGAFHIWPVPDVVRLVHGEEDPAVHGFQAIAHVRQRAPHDHAHRVVEVGAAHFLFEADGKGFFGERIHGKVEIFERDTACCAGA